jgi:hypothetical protein
MSAGGWTASGCPKQSWGRALIVEGGDDPFVSSPLAYSLSCDRCR